MPLTAMIVGEDHMAMLHITNGALSWSCLALVRATTTLWDWTIIGHVTNLSTAQACRRGAHSFGSPFWIRLLSLAPGRVLHSVAPLALPLLHLARATSRRDWGL